MEDKKKLTEIKRYLKVWLLMTMASFSRVLASRFGILFFLTGKTIRFLFFLGFLVLLVKKTRTLVGYTLWQVIFFFLIFNFIDILVQLLFREVYRFRGLVVSGDLDLILVKPISPLLKVLVGGADLLDLLTLIPLLGFIIYTLGKLSQITLLNGLLFILLLVNSFIIAFSFHVFVLAIGVLTTEVDHTIWIYRDLSSMARVPIDIYKQPLRGVLTFIIPVGIMMTFPAKALMGVLSWSGVVVSFLVGQVLLWGSLKFWRYSLTCYTSASS